MREIAQSETPALFGAEANPPAVVYDTSGPYTDPSVTCDIRHGLLALRAAWIEQGGDTEPLADYRLHGETPPPPPELASRIATRARLLL